MPTEKQIVPHGDVTLNVQLTPTRGGAGKGAGGGLPARSTKKPAFDKHTTIDPFN